MPGKPIGLGRGVIIAANKWDLMKDQGPEFVKTFDEELRQQLKFLDYAKILHISASTGERTPRLLETIDAVAESRRKRIKTSELNAFVERVSAEHPPASPGRRHVRILYAAQTGVAPPTFVFFTNVATTFHFSYQRYLENRLREEFGFEGTPITASRARTTRAGTVPKSSGRLQRFQRFQGSSVPKVRGMRSVVEAAPRIPGTRNLREPLNRLNPLEPLLYWALKMTQKWFKAADVCEMAELQPYVLRSWEKEFPGIGVQKSAESPRLYRQSDVEQVKRIKQLVFGEGLTLAGARRRLEESASLNSVPPTRTSRKCSKRSRRMRGRASRACATVFVRFSSCCRARRERSSSWTTIASSRRRRRHS